MYSECFICRRSLGTNGSIAHLATGRKIAFDPDRGRLWVVCPHCGQWCLTPSDERWEALEECEALYRGAEARVSTANVGLARAGDVELIRIGSALRDEIANWRYGPRLARRRRRMKIIGGTLAVGAGAVAGAGLYGVISLAIATGSAGFAAYIGVMGIMYVTKLTGITAWTPVARLQLDRGKRRTMRRSDLSHVWMMGQRGSRAVQIQLALSGDLTVTYSGDDALSLLAHILPHANWRGADVAEIQAATVLVDKAEHASAHKRHENADPWHRLAAPGNGHKTEVRALMAMPLVERLALEMAVDEELERRAMSGEAATFAAQWATEEEIARTADDMFLPGWITDWMRAAKRQLGTRGDARRH